MISNRLLLLVGKSIQRLVAFEIDLDNFKGVNEELGHSVGDEALRLFCTIVKNVLEFQGEVYRRGGDEIVALIPELDAQQAQMLAEKVRAAVEERFRKWGAQHNLAHPPTASIGLAVVEGPRSAADVKRLIDSAQGEAKRQGKNRVICLDSDTNGAVLH